MIPIPQHNNPHICPVQIRFDDIDIAAHVNNAVYQSYFDLAKTHFFNDTFGALIDWKIRGLVLAHIEIDFYKPTYLDDNIIIESSYTKLGEKSFDMTQVIRVKGTTNNEGIKCVGKSIMVAYNYKKAYSFSLPKEWADKIKETML